LEFTRDLEGKQAVWQQLIRLYAVHNRYSDELFVHIQLAQMPNIEFETISNAVNRFNNIVRQTDADFDEGEKVQIVRTFIELMESRLDEADATDCSRLGWLFMHSNQQEKAREIAQRGLEIEEENEHCKNLMQKLNAG
jgi:hypothetical protein